MFRIFAQIFQIFSQIFLATTHLETGANLQTHTQTLTHMHTQIQWERHTQQCHRYRQAQMCMDTHTHTQWERHTQQILHAVTPLERRSKMHAHTHTHTHTHTHMERHSLATTRPERCREWDWGREIEREGGGGERLCVYAGG